MIRGDSSLPVPEGVPEVSGVFRGCFEGVLGMFRSVPGVFRCIPGFTDTRILKQNNNSAGESCLFVYFIAFTHDNSAKLPNFTLHGGRVADDKFLLLLGGLGN